MAGEHSGLLCYGSYPAGVSNSGPTAPLLGPSLISGPTFGRVGAPMSVPMGMPRTHSTDHRLALQGNAGSMNWRIATHDALYLAKYSAPVKSVCPGHMPGVVVGSEKVRWVAR